MHSEQIHLENFEITNEPGIGGQGKFVKGPPSRKLWKNIFELSKGVIVGIPSFHNIMDPIILGKTYPKTNPTF